MKKIINFCGNCPFCDHDYDDGINFIFRCGLSRFLKLEDYFIDDQEKTPVWCPLKNEVCAFEFKEFSSKRQEDIDLVKNEIKELENFFDESINYECTEAEEKTLALRDSYIKLYDFQINEELSFDSDFQNEIIDKIEEIKQQLNSLDDANSKLQKTVSDVNVLYRND